MTALLGAIGIAIGVVRAIPQLVRLKRSGNASGVSLDTAATSSVVSFGWAVYGLLTGQPVVSVATASSGVVFAAVSVAAVHAGRRSRELRTAPIWLAALVGTGGIAGASGLGFVLPLSVLVANVPQLLVAYREDDLTGLSLGTWSLSLADGMVWGTYALIASDHPILAYSVLQLCTSGIIVVRRCRRAAGRPS